VKLFFEEHGLKVKILHLTATMNQRFKAAIVFFFLLSLPGTTKAQDAPSLDNVHKYSIYGELGGNALIYSLNYDQLLVIKQSYRTSLRVGAGFIPHVYLGIPVEVNTMFGKHDHFLETGLGITPVLGDYKGGAFTPSLMAVGRIGYRHQSPDGGQIVRIGVNLLSFIYSFENKNDRLFMPWGGISWGYTL
jgi:hypothetical protein